MNPWYEISNSEEAIHLVLKQSQDRYWPPSILLDHPLDAAPFRGRRAVLTGQSAVWIYAHAAAVLTEGGAAAIEVLPQGPPGSSQDISRSHCSLRTVEGDPARALLSIKLEKEPGLAEEAIRNLMQEPLGRLAKGAVKELCITGPAGVAAYATIARVAVQAGVDRIACWSPNNGLIVVFDRKENRLGQLLPPPEWLDRMMPPPASSAIIGVTGDPNRGKSVFSVVLEMFLDRENISGWRLDCDGQSPTAPWFLHMLRSDPTLAKAKRDEGKRSWTLEMEALLADQMGRMRRFFELGLADLPGGNHTAKPPERIPPGRERIFRQVDALILLEVPTGNPKNSGARPCGNMAWKTACSRCSVPGNPKRSLLCTSRRKARCGAARCWDSSVNFPPRSCTAPLHRP